MFRTKKQKFELTETGFTFQVISDDSKTSCYFIKRQENSSYYANAFLHIEDLIDMLEEHIDMLNKDSISYIIANELYEKITGYKRYYPVVISKHKPQTTESFLGESLTKEFFNLPNFNLYKENYFFGQIKKVDPQINRNFEKQLLEERLVKLYKEQSLELQKKKATRHNLVEINQTIARIKSWLKSF